MARPQAFWYWFEISAASFFLLCWLLAWLSRMRRPSTAEMVKLLRGADMKRFSEFFLTDDALRGALSRRGFLERQRVRIYEAREIMAAAFHSMSVLIAWAGSELRRESGFLRTGKGDEQSAALVEGHRQLLAAARDFRNYAFLVLVRLTFWQVFLTHWWLPLPPPRIAGIQRILGHDFFPAYGKVFKAAAEVTGQYFDGFTEEVLAALFRIDDPAAMIRLWRESGLLRPT